MNSQHNTTWIITYEKVIGPITVGCDFYKPSAGTTAKPWSTDGVRLIRDSQVKLLW